jgi:branched-chain amino acid transport system permease protein
MLIPLTKDRRLLVFLGIFLAVLLLPFVVHDAFFIRLFTEAAMWIGLSLAFDVLAGYTGYLNFGHSAFFGIGAYTTGLLMMKSNWPFYLALPVSALTATLAALIIGFPTLRLRGAYFSIATWALARAILQGIMMIPYAGGNEGIQLKAYLNPLFFFYVMSGLVGVTFFVLWFLLERAPFGLKLKAIREDQESAKALGLNPTKLKMQAFIMSAIPTALIGGIFAYWVTFIDPASTVGDLISDQALVMVVFGGMGTLIGPVIGAIIIFAFKTLFWAYLSAYEVLYLIILGAVIAISVVFLPDGVLGAAFRKGTGRHAKGSIHVTTPSPEKEA